VSGEFPNHKIAYKFWIFSYVEKIQSPADGLELGILFVSSWIQSFLITILFHYEHQRGVTYTPAEPSRRIGTGARTHFAAGI
jgi:hypothetical protein